MLATAKYSYPCMLKYDRKTAVESVPRKFGFVYLFFNPLFVTIINSLTSIETFSCIAGVDVTHLTAVQ